ncbi:site-specific integrase [Rothia nasisuis]|uniref:site-specific integrase n=1 Tax=Rothia nasisuis TaxID=2109647 RepID=UPI001F43057D|nr:site-specific integrase [Rothia nasisuis]
MASVHKYEVKNGRNERDRTRWAVKYKTPAGKWTFKRGFKTKAEAQQFLSGVEVAISRNEYVTPSDSRATVGELAPSWLARKEVELKPSSYRPIESAWRLHVEPVWGERVLKSILPTEVETWIANLQRGTTATGRKAVGATITIRCHEILAGVLDDAVKDKRLLVNPARGLNLPRKGTKENVYLTHEQVAALAAESGRAELIYTLAYTGLRWGEAAALQVQDIDFTPGRGRINVKRNLVELNAG